MFRPAPEGKIFHTVSSRQVLLLNDGKVAKLGKDVCQHEADNMNFIRKHTSIPVPEVFDEYDTSDGRHCIIMSHIPGIPLQEAWLNMPDESRSSIIEQLIGYIHELRQLKGEKCQLCIWFSDIIHASLWIIRRQSSTLLI